MNKRARTGRERRRYMRIAAKGAVHVRCLDHAQCGRLANVARGGVFVWTSIGAPQRLLRRMAELAIRIDHGDAEWLHGTGQIVRIGDGGLAIAFDEPSPALLRMIDRLTTEARASARVLSIVLIDADDHRRHAMAAGFRATGCNIIEASTPLEAVVRLGEATFEPDVIAVADSQAALELRAFIAREHPGVQLVTIGDEMLAPDGIARWLSSVNAYVGLPERSRGGIH